MGKPGELRERVVIEKATRAADGQGGSTTVWSSSATVYAQVNPLTAREAFFQGQEEHQVTHQVVIRKRSLKPEENYRFNFGGRLLSIVGEKWPSKFGREYSEYTAIE